MQDTQLIRHHVGKRLSEMAIYRGVVYLAGQVPETDARGSGAYRPLIGRGRQ